MRIFISENEMYPWLQLTMTDTFSISGVKISTRPSGFYFRFKHIEVRAGMSNLPNDFKGKLKNNELVGFYRGPAIKESQIITISFGRSIMAKYITIQHTGNQTNYLEVNEVTMITGKNPVFIIISGFGGLLRLPTPITSPSPPPPHKYPPRSNQTMLMKLMNGIKQDFRTLFSQQ